MKVLAVIPARGGSKRLPGKNLERLGGRPLIAWAIDHAAGCDRVVITSDDNAILNEAWRYNPKVHGHKRDPHLAQDATPMLPVIKDAFLTWGADCDVIVTLQPTSPFRTICDVRAAVKLLRESGADSVFSVTDAPEDLVFEVGHANRLRRLPNIVVPNGALFVITSQALLDGKSWFDGMAYGYSMPKDRSLDIDTRLDLDIARMMLQKQAA